MSELSWDNASHPSAMFSMLEDILLPYEMLLEYGLRCCFEVEESLSQEQKEIVSRVNTIKGIDDELIRIRALLKEKHLESAGNNHTKEKQVEFWFNGGIKSLLHSKEDYENRVPIRAGDSDLSRVYYCLSTAISRKYAPSDNFPFSAESDAVDNKFADILRELIPDPLVFKKVS